MCISSFSPLPIRNVLHRLQHPLLPAPANGQTSCLPWSTPKARGTSILCPWAGSPCCWVCASASSTRSTSQICLYRRMRPLVRRLLHCVLNWHPALGHLGRKLGMYVCIRNDNNGRDCGCIQMRSKVTSSTSHGINTIGALNHMILWLSFCCTA
jgi:hypothetical protein